jgi:hypothetical protein
MTRAIVASGVVMALALGACAADPDQGSITPTTSVHSETGAEEQAPVEEQAPTEEHTVEQGDDIGPDDGAGILPEPGDGLEHPKSPNTTMIVPPPRD